MLLRETLPYCRGDHFALRHARYERPGIYTRDSTGDPGELREAHWLLAGCDMSDEVVAHVGAGVGCVAALASHQGAERVVAFEPEECRLAVLRRQARDRPNISAIRAALGPRLEHKSIQFMVEGKPTLQHDVAHLTVESLSYVKPTSLVISALGAEQTFAWKPPPTVRTIYLKTTPMGEQARSRVAHLLAGFRVVREGMGFAHTPRVWYEWRRNDG